MKGKRAARVQEEIRREIGEILQNRASDPRLTWVSILRVTVSRDLSHAKVFVSVLGDDDAQESSLRALVKAAPFVRTELGKILRIRRVPELHFVADQGIRYSLRINQILRELGLDDAAPVAERGPEEE